jgi:hypothetical protein
MLQLLPAALTTEIICTREQLPKGAAVSDCMLLHAVRS